ncbi:MAG TPA: hypothetical protein D7I03_00760 [Candidatus Poseidoniales archaeon]|nr:MAG TPA: hypothetical protein D7I03_00760 [Candidatus Poseidoniales archaeon]HII49846.1 hypothetical protein [Candidatus Poseidoniaceae archaeon]|tara:strand:- start:6206 stop:7039 length:834 start_codon:yes stop_codon:yes gene_type:complete
MEHIELAGLEFHHIEAGSIFIGENKGGWIYASQRPKHEVRCPDFYITKTPLNLEQLSSILGTDLAPGDDTTWNSERLAAIINILNEQITEISSELSSEYQWEIRCPTQSEWVHAKNLDKIIVECKAKEILADAVSSNYRGAMMDGRPRQFSGHGPMQWHTATMEIHPNNKAIHALSSAPMDRNNSGLSVRLVITPIRDGAPRIVPTKADYGANIRSELLWTTLLGIVPSFAIPWLRGMGDYVYSGWVNLLFGGLCVGFVTGAFWRPRRPVIMYEQGE